MSFLTRLLFGSSKRTKKRKRQARRQGTRPILETLPSSFLFGKKTRVNVKQFRRAYRPKRRR